jgi:hypothetical protein
VKQTFHCGANRIRKFVFSERWLFRNAEIEFREARSLAIAAEETADAHALGMIATETGMDSVDPQNWIPV